MNDDKLRVAIVGSGIAGLSSAWLLQRAGHAVTVFERLPAIGMRAHGTPVNGHVVDVPLRVFNPLLWPNLVALAEVLGLSSRPADIACSFADDKGEVYLRYKNLEAGARNWPLGFQRPYLSRHVKTLFDVGRLRLSGGHALERGDLEGKTFRAFLDDGGFSDAFVLEYLYPLLATVCTCSNRALDNYPAAVLVESIDKILVSTSLRRMEGGTNAVVCELARDLLDVRTNVVVERVGDGEVVLEGGERETFDHVVLAVQANHALKLVDDQRPERALLSRIAYERFPISVHTDARFLPAARADWSPLNFGLTADRSASMSTILVNRVDGFPEEEPVLQTWNPLFDPAPGTEVMRVDLERPVVTDDSLAAIDALTALQDEAGRRLWFVGSYAARGVPLLETGVRSSLWVAERLGAERPWRIAA